MHVSNNYWITDYWLKLNLISSVFYLISVLVYDFGQAQCNLTFEGQHNWNADNRGVSDSLNISVG